MRNLIALLAALTGCATPVAAQIGRPLLGGTIDRTLGAVGSIADPALRTVDEVVSNADTLARLRLDRIDELVRRNRKTIERDDSGAPARRGELLLVDPTQAQLATARDAGFVLKGEERLAVLNLAVVRLAVPIDQPLARAEALLRSRLPDATITADTLHEPAGAVETEMRSPSESKGGIETPVGLIDGGPGPGIRVAATRGFATGAPRASAHGSATASLLVAAGIRRILVADVYGADPAGGNALAVARALDWLTGAGVRVISISLVGPDNPLIGRAVAAARRRGTVVVAAVGNDGPAAPPAYPASYPGVLAVTAVDGRNRALIEAGRALHLDYAAPGADMAASDARGRWRQVRGTSYAVPLVAARAAAAVLGGDVVQALDREAQPLGNARLYGRGLLCGDCRRSR
ncbi:MAG: peptidase S8 [Sphingobium sp.]|uniref:S8 family serine peptidase n=1 Tax=Sphingobium sp. TaxID=1912891 RepID=UPI000DB3472B|nr:S8 family serine peptidase [Sphingobium sp.]PZU08440.1 MAG: peptidase S8 [Sphingobium sp.]